MKQAVEEPATSEPKESKPELAEAKAEPDVPKLDTKAESATKNIAVDIPNAPNDTTVNGASTHALEDVPLSADTDQAVENVPTMDPPTTSREPALAKEEVPVHANPVLANPVHANIQNGSAMKKADRDDTVNHNDTHDHDPVESKETGSEELSDETVTEVTRTVDDEETDIDRRTEETTTSSGSSLTRDRQDSLASLSTDTDSCWGSSEGTLQSSTLPEKAEADPPPVQNVQKKDIVVEAVDIGVSPQQAQFVVLESVTEEDEETLKSEPAEARNGNAESAKVRTRDNVADDGAAPAAPLNGKQVVFKPPVSKAVSTDEPGAATTSTTSSTGSTVSTVSTATASAEKHVMIQTQSKTKLKPQQKRDPKGLAVTLRIVVALPLVVVVLYCTYRFTHLPIPNRSSP